MSRELAVLDDDLAVALHAVIVHVTGARGNGLQQRNVRNLPTR